MIRFQPTLPFSSLLGATSWGHPRPKRQHYRQPHQRGATPCYLYFIPSPNQKLYNNYLVYITCTRSRMQTSHHRHESCGVSKATPWLYKRKRRRAPLPGAPLLVQQIAACVAWKALVLCLHIIAMRAIIEVALYLSALQIVNRTKSVPASSPPSVYQIHVCVENQQLVPTRRLSPRHAILGRKAARVPSSRRGTPAAYPPPPLPLCCLLYTSDAADE